MRLGLLALMLIGSSVGCTATPATPTTPTPPPSSGAVAQNDPFASAKGVIQAHCAKCHTMQAASGPPSSAPERPRAGWGLQGPSLAKVGADPAHTKAWLIEHIRNPQAHKPNSRMPQFGTDKLSDEQANAMADYLASLK